MDYLLRAIFATLIFCATVVRGCVAAQISDGQDTSPDQTVTFKPVPQSLYFSQPRVRHWIDRSRNHNDLINESTGTEPDFYARGLNGRSVIAFPVHGQTLHTARAFGVDGDADRTLITVQHYLVVATGTNTTGQAFGIDFAPDLNIFYLPYHWQTDNIIGDRPDILARWNVDVAMHQDSLSTGRVDGAPVGSPSAITLNTVTAPMTIGTRIPGDGLSRPGEVAEILYYTRALTDGEIGEIESYLACKWGLRGDFPEGQVHCPSQAFSPKSITGLSSWYDADDKDSIVLRTRH